MLSEREWRGVVGVRIDATTLEEATERVVRWAKAGESRAVYAAAVHSIVGSLDDPEVLRAHNEADLVTPDGRPIFWAVRSLGAKSAQQVMGTSLAESVLNRAAEAELDVALVGGRSDEALAQLGDAIRRRHPGVRIVHAVSPPFRPLTDEEDAAIADGVAQSGAHLVLVGLGCPKQELWCHRHRDRVPATKLAVGAAFDFYAGVKRKAPEWVSRAGLEWAFRIAMEPGRLWKRYARCVPLFLWTFGLQRAGLRKFEDPPSPPQ